MNDAEFDLNDVRAKLLEEHPEFEILIDNIIMVLEALEEADELFMFEIVFGYEDEEVRAAQVRFTSQVPPVMMIFREPDEVEITYL